MTAPDPSAIPVTEQVPAQTPAAATPAPAEPAKKSLEDNLASLDEDARTFVMGEVTKARTEAQNLRARLKEAEPKITEYDKLVQAGKTELERATEELTRWQSEAERWRSTSVTSRVEALAAGTFVDPSDAVAAVDPSKYIDAGGQIDDSAIKADLEAVLQRKPHWRRQEGTPAPRVPAPNRAQGSSGGPAAADPAAEFAAILQGRLHGS